MNSSSWDSASPPLPDSARARARRTAASESMRWSDGAIPSSSATQSPNLPRENATRARRKLRRDFSRSDPGVKASSAEDAAAELFSRSANSARSMSAAERVGEGGHDTAPRNSASAAWRSPRLASIRARPAAASVRFWNDGSARQASYPARAWRQSPFSACARARSILPSEPRPRSGFSRMAAAAPYWPSSTSARA